MQEIVVSRVANPALDGNGIVWKRSSVRALFGKSVRRCRLTFVEDVAHRAVINDHDFAKVRLHLGKVLDISSVSEGTMLPVIAACEVLAFRLEPVNDWVSILLHAGRECDQIIPLGDLDMLSRGT